MNQVAIIAKELKRGRQGQRLATPWTLNLAEGLRQRKLRMLGDLAHVGCGRHIAPSRCDANSHLQERIIDPSSNRPGNLCIHAFAENLLRLEVVLQRHLFAADHTALGDVVRIENRRIEVHVRIELLLR